MRINTTYPNSISFTPKMIDEMNSADTIEVHHKDTGKHLASLNPADVIAEGHHVWVKDRHGNTKRSYYRVYKF